MPGSSDEILHRVRKLARQVAARADEIAMRPRLRPPAGARGVSGLGAMRLFRDVNEEPVA